VIQKSVLRNNEPTTTMKTLSPIYRIMEQNRLVTAWNAQHRPGIRVIVQGDDGKPFKTTTRSEAWLVGGHTAVINLTGISGGFRLDRVKPDTAPLDDAA
jgi:hypothetical protein